MMLGFGFLDPAARTEEPNNNLPENHLNDLESSGTSESWMWNCVWTSACCVQRDGLQMIYL